MSQRGFDGIDRWGRAISAAGLQESFFDWAIDDYFRVEWEGLSNIPRRGGALLVANHAGMLPIDGKIVQRGVERELDRHVYGLAHKGFFRFPFMAREVERMGMVSGHPDNAVRLLRDEDALVLVFPEGAKGPVKPPDQRYKLQRFGRGGFVEAAMRSGVPVVPIVLAGTEDTTPVLGVLPSPNGDFPITLNTLLFGPLLGPLAQFPAKIRVRVLEPVEWEPCSDHTHVPLSVLMDRAEEVRSSMQDQLDKMLYERDGIYSDSKRRREAKRQRVGPST